MAERFRRPADIPYPNVWLTFEAPDENDQPAKYRIQDLPLDRMDDAINHMRANYLTEETLCRTRNLANEKAAVSDFTYIWSDIIEEEKMTLACFKEGSDEIVAVNILYVDDEQDEEKDYDDYESKNVKEIESTINFIFEQFDSFHHYGVDACLADYGLSVQPLYRRLGIATKLLEARKLLGKACGLELTTNLITSDEAQKLVEKAGFEKNYEISFAKLTRKNKKFSFNVKNKESMVSIYSKRL